MAVTILYCFTSIPELLYKPTNLQIPHLTNQFPTATNLQTYKFHISPTSSPLLQTNFMDKF
jgi:hypothetical protein